MPAKDQKTIGKPRSRLSQAVSGRFLLAIFCVLLVLFGTTVQAVHSHPDGDVSHADCSLCVTSHLVAQVVAQPLPVAVAVAVWTVRAFLPLTGHDAVSTFALFTRPPPASKTLA